MIQDKLIPVEIEELILKDTIVYVPLNLLEDDGELEDYLFDVLDVVDIIEIDKDSDNIEREVIGGDTPIKVRYQSSSYRIIEVPTDLLIRRLGDEPDSILKRICKYENIIAVSAEWTPVDYEDEYNGLDDEEYVYDDGEDREEEEE